MRIHHATAAKAQKLGFILTLNSNSDAVEVSWPERNKKFVTDNPTQGVADMTTLKMLTLEYPALKPVFEDGKWFINHRGGEVAQGDTLQAAWDEFCEENGGELEEFEDEADEDETEKDEDGETEGGKSIVKRTYKRRYKPFKMTCGDELSALISAHVTVTDEDGVKRVDPEKLKKFARINQVWVSEYANLNIGQQRMNIGNRLRAKVRRDNYEIIWN